MHRVYFQVEPDAEEILLEGEAHHYVSRVIRLAAGDRLVLFDPSGWEWVGRVLQIDRQSARVRIEEKRPNRCEPARPVWLVQGLPKGAKFFEIVRAATALGAAGIIPFAARRTIGARGGKSDAWQARCERIALEAVRQCGRARPPKILQPEPSLKAALEQAASAGPLKGVCLWEEAKEPLADCLRREDLSKEGENPLTMVVGPEGGLTAHEAELARARGLSLGHLGPRILRTELAPIAALSILQYCLGQME